MFDAFQYLIVIRAKQIMRQFNEPSLIHDWNGFLEIMTNHAVYFWLFVAEFHLEILNHVHNLVFAR